MKRKPKLSQLSIFLLMLINGYVSLPGFAQVPQKLTYQGSLILSSGTPVVDGNYTLKFELFGAVSGGTALWTEVSAGVPVTRGAFSAILGATTMLPSSIFSAPVFLEFSALAGPSITSPVTFTPRAELTSSPYAMRAIAAGPTGSAGGDLTGSYPNPTIATAAVTSAKILDGSVGNADLAPDAVTSAKIANGTILFADMGQNSAATGQVIKWSGTTWTPATDQTSSGDFLPRSGGAMDGEITSSGDPPITMGKANFGSSNTNNGSQAFVAGNDNRAIGNYSAVIGGRMNTASGASSMISGGEQNTALGSYSFAAGRRAKANHSGAFVWADATNADFSSSGANQLLIRASGGVGIGTNSFPSLSTQLHVQSSALDNGGVTIGGGGSNEILYVYANTSSNYGGIQVKRPFVQTDNLILQEQGGNVGIGTTSPSQKLSVAGNICYTGSIGACSDIRYKKDITSLSSSLEKILSLRGVNYYWRADEFPDNNFTKEKQIGLIAQEVEKIYPEVVLTDKNGYKSIDYSHLTPVLIEAVKELNARNEKLETRLAGLEAVLRKLAIK